uniref:SPHK1 interactor, AKAP domain containing n=1 Tax=Lepisosteus oculatus TaxID=7918 RepID=W5MNS3_LEPOC|nr:PREDICTED: A-kinase anchor protein SPHKAP isoform X1 [Lepisosteus oculatus]
MLSALLNMLKNLTESNFETTPMREISENLEDSLDTVGASTSSSLDSSVTACKKVLCSNSLLDSTEYWLRNEKTLCKIGFLEDKCDSSCTTICFVNLDRDSKDQCDDTCIKKLASVSPALPKLIDSLNVKQPRDNEIFLLSGLDSSGTCPQDSSNQQSLRVADVCLVQCARGNKSNHPSCLIFEINKFLIGIESGQEKQLQLERYGHHRPEDDTNRSVSSIEEDFLTASEHLEDSEEDAFRNDFENSDFVDLYTHEKNPGGLRSDRHRNVKELYKEPQWSEESGATPHGAADKDVKLCHSSSLQNTAELHARKAYQSKRQGFSSSSQVTRNRHSTVPRQSATAQHNLPSTPETAGYYATNLAESVLQDAFIKLSQEEPTFTAEAALSVSAGSNTVLTSKREDPKPARSCSFELPKIVIVQSPDNCESMIEWPGTLSSSPDTWVEHDFPKDVSHQPPEEHGQHCSFGSSRRTPKPVEVALACAASVIGTISSPKATEKLKIDPSMVVPESQTADDYEEDENEEFAEPNQEGKNYSFSSALCGMTQVASAVAVVDLTEEEQDESYSPSRGLLSVAEASTAITLHCSVAIGTKIEQFKTNIAEVLLKEASSVLTKPENHKSVADFLESTHNKIVASITKPNTSNLGETEMDDLAHILSNAIFKHSLEKAMKKRELGSPSKDISNLQGLVLENTNNLILDVLRITCKKISDISHHGKPSSDVLEDKFSSRDSETIVKESKGPLNQLLSFIGSTQAVNNENQMTLLCCKDNLSRYTGIKEENVVQEQKESEPTNTSCSTITRDQRRASQANVASLVKDFNSPQCQPSKNNVKDSKISETDKTMSIFESKQTFQEMFSHNGSFTEKHKGSTLTDDDNTSNSLLSEQLLSPPVVTVEAATVGKSPVSGFADDLATTVVSMATEMAAICLENSHGKQPWFCAWKGGPENPENYLMPCRTVKRKKDVQSNVAVTKKHRPPRLSEIKKKTEEQPELMERLMNRVVDESMNLDEPPDPFTLFATEVTAKIMNCPELNVVDTSKPGHPRNRLQCDRWSRGKASSYESIPEEDGDSSNLINALSPGTRLGQNMSRGSSISKQSSCESITDEFSRFMVNQMENEGRGFDLLLDYYAGKNANSILSSAMQQVTKKNGHLNVRSTCLSKQSSTESITEEFYRFMLKEMDKENKDFNISKTKEWSNSLLPPSPRTPFCFRQSSMPDRRSSDSRLTVNSPMKANSFDGFARNIHGDTLNIYPGNSASSMGLCKSDSCLYQRGQTDQITDMLIHETWSNSIESLMRKNKIIVDEEESIDLEQSSDSQPHVEQFANQLAADIVESGKSLLGGQQETVSSRPPIPLAEKRRCFKSHLRQQVSDKARSTQEKPAVGNDSGSVASLPRSPREVPLIHIEADQREEFKEDTRHHDLTAASSVTPERECHPQEKPTEVRFDPGPEKMSLNSSSLECNKTIITSVVENASASEECTNNISSSDESTGSWLQIANEEDLPEDTSSYIQLSEGNGNSSTSSLGFVDLESLQESCSPCKSLSEESEEKERLKENLENVDECTSGLSIGAGSSHELLVMNFDLDPECVDSELRATLQWIAASELGVPTIYFRKSQEKSIEKFLDMVQTVHQKDWNIGDLFHAVVQYCKLQEESDTVTSLFDWLLEKR